MVRDYDEKHWEATFTLVFRNLPPEEKKSRLWDLLEDGYQHVEVWSQQTDGVWIRVDPCIETIVTDVLLESPAEALRTDLKVSLLSVRRLLKKGRVREPFFFGAFTCVELAKAFIGVRAPFVRTPYQLYKFLRKHP